MEIGTEMKSTILGVIRITMENLNYSETDIRTVLWEAEDGTLDTYTLEDIRRANNGREKL